MEKTDQSRGFCMPGFTDDFFAAAWKCRKTAADFLAYLGGAAVPLSMMMTEVSLAKIVSEGCVFRMENVSIYFS